MELNKRQGDSPPGVQAQMALTPRAGYDQPPPVATISQSGVPDAMALGSLAHYEARSGYLHLWSHAAQFTERSDSRDERLEKFTTGRHILFRTDLQVGKPVGKGGYAVVYRAVRKASTHTILAPTNRRCLLFVLHKLHM